MWWLVVTVSVPSGFSDLMVLGVCCEFLCRLQWLFHALSSEVNHNATARMAASPNSFPCRQPDLGVQYHPWSKVHSGDSLYYPIQWVEIKDGATWELIRGLGYSGSFLPSWLGLSPANLLYREDFLWSAHRIGVTLVHAGFTGRSPDV